MRKWLIVSWLLLPVLVGAYHFGPGQERVKLDTTDQLIRQAESYVAEQSWSQAVASYEAALAAIPSSQADQSRRVRLELAKAQMFHKKLPQANQSLKLLLDELASDDTSDPRLLAETRSALANSQYYITWLMRLEGMPKEQWEPEIEVSRQTYKLLAEQSREAGDETAATRHMEDLESSIRLARMDIKELQGLPLPSQ